MPDHVEELVTELKKQVEAFADWMRKRGHDLNCWGREDPKQCICGLSDLLKDIPPK